MALLLTALALAGGWPGPVRPPAAARAPVRLERLPQAAARRCRSWQSRTNLRLLCPRRLPEATLAPAGGRLPPLRADVVGAPRRPGLVGLLGLEFSYAAPVEPTSGRGWRAHLWWNRPCCFLHFGVYRLVPPAGRIPAGVRPALVGGKRGLVLPALGHGLGRRRGIWWANHIWFFWSRRQARYVATLHVFGRRGEARALLGRLVRELRPAAEAR